MTEVKKESTNTKLESFIFRNRKVIITIAGVIVAAAVVLCVAIGVKDSSNKKGLAAVDKVEFEYTVKSSGLTESEVSARQEKALADIGSLCGKSGIVGVRANMLAADVYFAKKDYSSALSAYNAAAEKGRKFYTAAICNEELGNKEEAVKLFAECADTKDFLLASHALFNSGRLQEELGLVKEASETYKKATEKYSNDPWANLSQSRIIDLQAKGLID